MNTEYGEAKQPCSPKKNYNHREHRAHRGGGIPVFLFLCALCGYFFLLVGLKNQLFALCIQDNHQTPQRENKDRDS